MTDEVFEAQENIRLITKNMAMDIPSRVLIKNIDWV